MSSNKKIQFKRIKSIDKIWHEDSTLVFKSPKEKLVIGRYENNKLIPLDDICLDLCDQWNFKYDKDLIEEDDGEENDDEEVDTEEVQSEEQNKQVDIEEDVDNSPDTTDVKELENDPDETEVNDIEETQVSNDTEEVIDEDYEIKVNKKNVKLNKDVKTTEENHPKVDFSIDKVGNNEKIYIMDMTSDFSKSIHKYFDTLQSKHIETITNLQHEIVHKDKNITELTNNYKKLKTKFDKMTQFLNE